MDKQQPLTPAPGRQRAQRPTPPLATAAHQRQPLTPLVNLVLWLICGTGWLIGWSSGPHVLESSVFRAAFVDPGRAHVNAADAHAMSHSAPERAYCVGYLDPVSALYLSSRYIVGCALAVPVGWVTRVRGRRFSLACGFAAFAAAHMFRAAAVNWAMLFISQVLDGICVAFLYQAPYLEGTEVAPDGRRGLFVFTDQIGRSMGVWSRSLMQEGIANQHSSPAWGWRVVGAFGICPALFLLVLTIYIPETPSSLIQRGQLQAGRAALRAIRGPLQPASELDREFNSILAAAGISEHTSAGHWSQARKLVRREQLPPLLLLTLLTAIRQLSGGDFVLLFNTPMQKSLGIAGPQGGFYSRQIVNASYLFASCLGAYLTDAWGRVPTFALSSALAALGYVIIAAILAERNVNGVMSRVALAWLNICVAVVYGGFVLAWGGGYFLVLTEMFPLSTRSFALSLGVTVTFALYALSSGLTWRWLCALRWHIFIVFAVCNIVGLAAILFLMPEVAGVPLESIQQCFAAHWLWRRLLASTDGSSSSSSSGEPGTPGEVPQQQQKQQPEAGTGGGHMPNLLLQPSGSLQRGSGALPSLPSGGASSDNASRSAFSAASTLPQGGSREVQQGDNGAAGGGGLIAFARARTGTRTVSTPLDLKSFRAVL